MPLHAFQSSSHINRFREKSQRLIKRLKYSENINSNLPFQWRSALVAQRLGQPRHRKTTNFLGKTG
jgi:hypothetical protein